MSADSLADREAMGFKVDLEVFEGPFDLLLQLISKHELDITDVALSVVTEEFVRYIATLDDNLDQTTHFLLVAATLLDLKTARLVPQADVDDEEDLALLEARDLLFARLLQYRAFKQVAAGLAARFARESRRYRRTVSLEPRFAELLPEVLISVGPSELAELAAKALTPRPEPVLSLAHLHAPTVSVKEQATFVADRLRKEATLTFRSLVADADVMTTVARFLALLELFREGVVAFEQASPLGDLHLRWTGGDDENLVIDVGDEFDAPHLPVDTETDSSGAEPSASEPRLETTGSVQRPVEDGAAPQRPDSSGRAADREDHNE